MANMEINIGDLCTHCGRDTSFESGELLFVNRIPSGTDGTLVLAGSWNEVKLEVEVTGYMCADCQSVECDECGNKVLDYSIRESKIICSDCDDVKEIKSTDDGQNCWDCGTENESADMDMCTNCGHTICWDCQGGINASDRSPHREGRREDGLSCGNTKRVY